jgi:IclR family acetate operon transcriptional repressor
MNQSAAKRMLLVLERLAGRPEGLALSEVCDELALPKSIAHRLLALLMESGFVQQDAVNGRYGLTLKLTMLGLRHYVRIGLDDLAQPILDRLAHDTGELARLAVAEGDRLVWVAKAQGARSGLRYDPDLDHDTGHDVVLHATATGKAWLATMPEARALAIVEATGLKTPLRFGPRVATSLADFRTLLGRTRRDRYGEAVEEGEPGTAAVAVAVHDASRPPGEAVATLSVAGPLIRFGSERRPLLAGRLAAAAEELGAIWPLRSRGDAIRGEAGWKAQTQSRRESVDDRANAAAL